MSTTCFSLEFSTFSSVLSERERVLTFAFSSFFPCCPSILFSSGSIASTFFLPPTLTIATKWLWNGPTPVFTSFIYDNDDVSPTVYNDLLPRSPTPLHLLETNKKPILSTLSDIVIYSPTSSGAARSRNAQRLARRFRGALERKYRDRVGGKVEVKAKEEEEHLPLKYNVFILDATADEIRRDLSHLVRRPWGDGEVPGASSSSSSAGSSSSASASGSGSGPFGDKDKDKDGDVKMTELDSESPLTHLPPNTVNFSQRERDEMRDLTRASEIITVWPRGEHQREEVESPVDEDESDDDEEEKGEYDEDVDTEEDEEPEGEGEEEEVDISTLKTHWDPSIGQVFLGNANDVPLPVGDGTEWELLAGREGFNRDEETEVDVWADLDWESVLTRTRSDETKSKRNGNVYTPTYTLPEGNTPSQGYGYDICIECHDQAPFPSGAHFKAAEEKIEILEEGWKRRVLSERERLRGLGLEGHSNLEEVDTFPPRPSPHPNSVIHLPMPGSPVSSSASVNAIMALVGFLRRCVETKGPVRIPGSQSYSDSKKGQEKEIRGGRRWSSVSSLMSSFSSPFGSSSTNAAAPSSPRQRSFTSSSLPSRHHHLCSSSSQCSCKTQTQSTRPGWSRPLKILIYSSDGYTESSILALCLLMALKQVDLPRAYLELQVEKRRSFFVYQMDLGVLRRVEDALVLEREREAKEREAMEKREREKKDRERREREARYSFVNGSGHLDLGNGLSPCQGPGMSKGGRNRTRPAAKSVSFARGHAALSSSSSSYISSYPGPLPVLGEREWEREQRSATMPPMSCSLPTLQSSESVLDSSMSNGNIGSIGGGNNIGQRRRPRAKTSPWLPSYSLFGGDHQNWFNDPRFDGSFPSRVLPFLYLGNLNHASNVYMLQALGITHVVSVGECALIPPHNVQNGRNSGSNNNNNNSNHYNHGHRTPGKSPDHHQGSLWIEEREGRIKVLDIQGVCDDGIDTLEPQLEPICDWIDQARQEGGQVLVHCRVGVSRSATVTIAYVMKHLSLPLVDAYLIVRSRRLSVLIQPNMRLLYNLLGWEIKLAKERAGGDERKLRHELSSALTWPYLAKEVHKLNEKYLQ